MNESLLKKHFEAAPRMEPQDAVKLAFQSAFGCGHLLPGCERCAAMIEKEIERVPQADVPAATSIGNGLCRLNLAAPEVRALGAGMIGRMMLGTQERVETRGDNEERFAAACQLIRTMAQRGEAPFSAEAFGAYWDAYEEKRRMDGGVVSHTQTYRDAYAPAYRVVLEDYARLLPLLASRPKAAVFDGPCGSGKSTLAGLFAALHGTRPIPMDDFFLPPEMRTPERLAEPGGNVHRERFAAEVLHTLASDGPVRWQRFDCQTGCMLPREQQKGAVIVIEGSYSHHPAFNWKQLGAAKVFISVDPAEQLRRIEKRSPDVVHMFKTRWIPLEKNYFEAYDIRGNADFVIDNPRSGAY